MLLKFVRNVRCFRTLYVVMSHVLGADSPPAGTVAVTCTPADVMANVLYPLMIRALNGMQRLISSYSYKITEKMSAEFI